MKLVKPKKMERRDISAESKLVWAEFFGPMQAAVAQLNAAITNAQNVVAGRVLQIEGVSNKEWALDMDTLTLVRKPNAE